MKFTTRETFLLYLHFHESANYVQIHKTKFVFKIHEASKSLKRKENNDKDITILVVQ